MTEETDKRNKVIIPNEVFQKMISYAELGDKQGNEVIGLLVIDEPKDGGLLVEDIIFPAQEITGAFCEVIWKGDWLNDLRKSGKSEKIKGFWHSHKHMGSWLSGHDQDILGDKWDVGKTQWAISMVVSLPNEIKAWLQYYRPIKLERIEIPVFIVQKPNDEIMKACEADFKMKVQKKVYNYSSFNDELGVEGFYPSEACDRKIPVDEEDDIDEVTGFSLSKLDNLKEDPKLLKDLEEEKAKCLHLSYNGRYKLVCFQRGKNYKGYCDTCEHKLSSYVYQKSNSETSTELALKSVTPNPDSFKEDLNPKKEKEENKFEKSTKC